MTTLYCVILKDNSLVLLVGLGPENNFRACLWLPQRHHYFVIKGQYIFFDIGTGFWYIIKIGRGLKGAYQGLSLRRIGFDPETVGVVFVVDKLSLSQIFPQVLRYFCISIIPLFLPTHLNVPVVRTGVSTLGTFEQVNSMLFPIWYDVIWYDIW